MPELEPSRSAPNPSSAPGTQLTQSRSNTASRPHLERFLSAQHLDDVSIYHGGDHESNDHDDDNETESIDELEQVRSQDYDEASRKGEDEVPEVRMGVADTRDLEANLEKILSRRSIKDPNLVRAINFSICK